jgi:opacity protein-like surface antigen
MNFLNSQTLLFTVALSGVSGFSGLANATDAGWEGWYGGIHLGRTSHQVATAYSHQHIGNCVNLNFGSEWPGDGCEGNQDYQTSQAASVAITTWGLSLARLWDVNDKVLGWHLDMQTGTANKTSFHQVLSTTWGDTLDVSTKIKQSASFRALVGLPQDRWLPFATLGLAAQRSQIRFVQDQPGHHEPVSGRKTQWDLGYILGVGSKYQMSDDWVLSAELLYQKIASPKYYSSGVNALYGLRYPDTTITNTLGATSLRVEISRRF